MELLKLLGILFVLVITSPAVMAVVWSVWGAISITHGDLVLAWFMWVYSGYHVYRWVDVMDRRKAARVAEQ